jgi:hypothetical protein
LALVGWRLCVAIPMVLSYDENVDLYIFFIREVVTKVLLKYDGRANHSLTKFVPSSFAHDSVAIRQCKYRGDRHHMFSTTIKNI